MADLPAQLGFPTRSIVEDDMASVVREFVPAPRFLACSGATEAVASTAIELADIDTRRLNGHEIAADCIRPTSGRSDLCWDDVRFRILVVERTMDSRLERNKEAAMAFYDRMFNRCEPAQAVEQFVGDTYIQHNPG